ncbi:sarcosine oxidase subunit alpha family protein [Castellaniella ginsengisoli]|uniref:Sarcosine oxidase subunit alpha family protein n=1 Tax=Castellaniella ginsengisoli TaxID=546114 RepID=A0AB39D8F8_9BURK
MNQDSRLPQGGRVRRGAPVRFTFNGKAYAGLQGDTLASALLANGVHFVARSFKYHRPRGIMTAGVEEPNALVQLESGAYTVPNARATEVELYEGLRATSVNAKPDIEHDRMAIMQRFARFIPAGFYYKTFMWPRSWWGKYEERIRDAAGLGSVPDTEDTDRYEKRYAHCDVLVVGAGPAGLAAACMAGRTGARVILVDDGSEAGGSLLRAQEFIDDKSALDWVADRMAELAAQPETQVLQRTTAFGYQDHNLVTACERLHDHLPIAQRSGVRERVWKIRARHVVLATGAHERPLVFGNNDVPGVMLASAVSAYIHRYGVLPGRRAVVFTNNDSAYQTAIDLKHHGADVTVVDPRVLSHGTLPVQAERLGIRIIYQAVVVEARGGKHVTGVRLRGHGASLRDGVNALACDLLIMSGGWNPVIHLYAQSRGKPRWCEERACFVPDAAAQPQSSAGAANGDFSLQDALAGGVQAGLRAVQGATPARPEDLPGWTTRSVEVTPLLPLWAVGKGTNATRGPKQFIDYQNDVSVSDILLAVSEGYHSVEHVKRYTAMGFGTDQGKLGNINGMGVLAEALKQSIPATGTTTFRPNYTPVSFGAMAGRELGDWFDPIRRTCLHDWNLEQGAIFEDVGNWKRAHYYPKPGEDMHAAVQRECLAVRNSVGLLDYSTLGKIDVRGPDAVEFLNRLYINSWTKLQPGRCRYGLLLDENGMVMDDGVSIRLAEDHFLLTTTTSGAARIMSWMERWLQTEWPDLRVYLTSVTDQYAVATVAGPHARKVLSAVCKDIDFSNEAFPFMSFQEGTIDGVFARVLRVSFSGELSYEVYMPANMGRHVVERLMTAGQPHGITPYGTETMHVLRGEKGYIIVGQDTDGSVTPMDLGMGGMLAKNKDCLGKRSLARSHTSGPGRKQFVGLLANDPACVLPEGGQILLGPTQAAIAPMFGHVTSSYMSPILGRSIALALLKDGHERMGEEVTVATADGRFMPARVCSPVFYDPEGARQNVE